MQKTEVYLAIFTRIDDDEYITLLQDLLKPGTVRIGNILITPVLIRHTDFEYFFRKNKRYSVKLWSKVPEMSTEEKDEYQLQAEDLREM
jgi:hypothetical protein